MKVMVIGSNSFSGSHMIDLLLSRDHQVIGVSRHPEKKSLYLPYRWHLPVPACELVNFSFRQANFATPQGFEDLRQLILRESPEAIINYAALTEVNPSHHYPLEYYQTNLLAQVRLMELLASQQKRPFYIHISSAEVYGDCREPVHRGDLTDPTTPYAISKAAADAHLESLGRFKHFDFALIRSTNVYGPGQQTWKLIPRAFIRLRRGEKIQLHNGGKFVRPFLYIRDACEGVYRVLERQQKGLWLFAPDNNLSVRAVVRRICELEGADFEAVTESVESRQGHDHRYWLSPMASRRKLGWEARYNIARGDGLREVKEWLESNWQEVKMEPLEYIHG